MRLCLLFLLPFALMGQTISGLAVDEIGPNCVRFTYTTSGVSGSTTFAIDAGLTSSLGATLNDETYSADGTYYRTMCHAKAGETWYYRISVGATTTDCTATCTNCTTSDQSQFASNSGGISCTNTEPFRITHSAAGTRTPTAPTGPSDVNPYDDCDSDTSPTISSCANLSTDLSTLAGTVGTHKIEVPAGVCTVSTEFALPALTSASRICIGPQYSDADLEPTDFTQVSMDHQPNMLTIRATDPMDRANFSVDTVLKLEDNYTLTDMVIEDVPTVPNPIQATVTGYSGTTSVTLTLSATCPAQFVAGGVVVLDMPGLSAYDSTVTITSCSSTSLVVASGTSFSGTLSGNGTATVGSVPISNAADNGSGAIRITTAVAHGLPADANYSGSDTVYVRNVEGTTEANGRWLFTVVDSTNIDLTSSTFTNAYSASSFDHLFLNNHPTFGYVEASSFSGVRMGRVIIGNAQPHYVGSTGPIDAQNTTNLVIRDSILLGGHINCPVSVTDDLPDCENYGSRNGGYLRGEGSTGLYMRNNLLLGSAGIGVEFNNTGTAGPITDFTFQNNQVIATDRPSTDVAGEGNWTNNLDHYQDNRHLMELKAGCERCLITENFFDGAVCSEEGRTCYAIALFNSPTSGTEQHHVRDVEISHNYFRNIGSAFGLAQQVASGTNNLSYPDRILFEENFIEGSATEIRQSPRSLSNAAVSAIQGGQVPIRIGSQRVDVKNNTWYRNTGQYGGCLVIYQGDKCPECVISGNIFTFHRSASVDEGLCRFSPSYSDYDESTNLTEFDKFAPGGSFADNLIIAGVEDPQDVSSNKASESDANTLTSAEMTSLWPTSGSFGSINLGPTDASYSARHTSVFGTDQEPDGDYSTYGVSDLAALRRGAFGEVRNLSVTHPGDLIFSFTAPTTTNCTVRLTDDAWSTASTAAATEGTYSQTVTFASIGSGSYEAIVECQNAKPLIWTGSL